MKTLLTILILFAASSALAQADLTIVMGHDYSCSLLNKKVICWGQTKKFGQKGVPENLGPVIAIAGGFTHVCTISEDQKVRCWGENTDGALNVPADLGAVIDVSAGSGQSCAVKASDRTVRCWGANNYGQTDVPKDLGPTRKIFSSLAKTCAILESGRVRCFGSVYSHDLDPSYQGPVKKVAIGFGEHACLIQQDNALHCWGHDPYGGMRIPKDLGPVSDVAVGSNHICATRISGQTVCWGANDEGQTKLPHEDVGRFQSIFSWTDHTCGLTTNRGVQCWGLGYAGQASPPPNFPIPSYGTSLIAGDWNCKGTLKNASGKISPCTTYEDSFKVYPFIDMFEGIGDVTCSGEMGESLNKFFVLRGERVINFSGEDVGRITDTSMKTYEDGTFWRMTANETQAQIEQIIGPQERPHFHLKLTCDRNPPL